jgi:hypothetical protein
MASSAPEPVRALSTECRAHSSVEEDIAKEQRRMGLEEKDFGSFNLYLGLQSSSTRDKKRETNKLCVHKKYFNFPSNFQIYQPQLDVA